MMNTAPIGTTMNRYIRKSGFALGIVVAMIHVAPRDSAAQDLEPATPSVTQEATQDDQPRLPDGRIDYLEILNRKLSEGVTAENNALVLLLEALGPSVLEGMNEQDYLNRLELDAFPSGRKVLDSPRGLGPDNPDGFDVLSRAWTSDDCPEWAEWLDNNREALAIVTEATRRDRFYQPLLLGEPGDSPSYRVLSALLPLSQECRVLARIITSRALLHAGNKETDAAIEDLKSVRRLASLMSRPLTPIEVLVAIAVDSIAGDAELRLLETGQMSAEQIDDYRKFLAKHPLATDLANCIETGEKSMFLDVVQCVRLDGIGSLRQILGESSDGEGSPFQGFLENAFRSAAIDWDAVTEAASIYSEMAEYAREPMDHIRLERMDEMENRFALIEAEATGKLLLGSLFLSRKSRGKVLGNILISILGPSLNLFATAEIRGRMQRDLTDVAMALEMYRLKHGAFPEELEKLAPNFLDPVPVDRFTGGKLFYKPEAGGYRLYSVGRNRNDDGGATFGERDRTDDIRIEIKLAGHDE